MRKRLILIAALPLSISLKPLAAQNEKIFIIDKQTVYQEIDNFSASDAWRCAFIGKNWPQEKKEKIADLLFKREFDKKGNPIGMALTNWRVNIGAGSYENREAKERWITLGTVPNVSSHPMVSMTLPSRQDNNGS